MSRPISTLAALCLSLASVCAWPAQQVIPIGAPNSGNGATLYTAFGEVNANFTDLYSFLYAPITGPVTITSGTNTSAIGTGVVTNGMRAAMPALTIKCNFLTSPSAETDCTQTQIAAAFSFGGGTGAVTLTAPAGFQVTGSPGANLGLIFAPAQAADEFLATPCGSSGALGLRALCAADLPNLTGAVTSAAGVTTIATSAVTLANIANQPAATLPCNPTGGVAALQPCTASQVNTMLGTSGGGAGGQSNILDICTYPGIDATGAADSRAALNSALQSIAGTNVTGLVNCPIYIAVGYNPLAPIFVRSGTNLEFTPAGLFIVDNNTIPAFVFLHTKNATWTNPRIEYTGALAINNAIAPVAGIAGSFNDTQIKGQMAANWGNTFTAGGSSQWPGPTNMSAVFKLLGAVQHVTFDHLKMFVADSTPATNFIPVAVSIDTEWLPSTLVNTNSGPVNATTSVGATDLNFLDPTLDGFYMGFVGSGGSGNYINPTFVRYSDLQDSGGGTQGGTGTWFAPPHAFYLEDNDPSFNAHNHVVNGYDWGVYVGGATRRTTASGSLLSLKMSITNGTVVDGYTSLRPDGFMDTITNFGATQGGVLRNVTGIYNSQTVGSNGGYVWGWRFPTTLHAYQNLSAQNITMIDLATAPTGFPVLGPSLPINRDVSITGLKVFQQDLPGAWQPTINLGGTNINLEAEYHYPQMSTTTQFLGSAINSGSFYCVSCNWDIKVFGWRQLPVAWSAGLALGATTAALAVNWPYVSGSYLVNFPSGETRFTTFTNGSTATSGFAALTSAEAATGSLAGNALVNNLNGYKQRVLVNYNGGSVNSNAHVLDVSNGYEITVANGVMTESWAQIYSGTPNGANQPTNIVYPNTFAIDRNSVIVPTAVTGATSFSVGWTSNTTALRSSVAVAGGTNPPAPLAVPIALPNSPTTVTLYGIGGSFTGGKVIVSTRAGQMSAAQ